MLPQEITSPRTHPRGESPRHTCLARARVERNESRFVFSSSRVYSKDYRDVGLAERYCGGITDTIVDWR